MNKTEKTIRLQISKAMYDAADRDEAYMNSEECLPENRERLEAIIETQRIWAYDIEMAEEAERGNDGR